MSDKNAPQFVAAESCTSVAQNRVALKGCMIAALLFTTIRTWQILLCAFGDVIAVVQVMIWIPTRFAWYESL